MGKALGFVRFDVRADARPHTPEVAGVRADLVCLAVTFIEDLGVRPERQEGAGLLSEAGLHGDALASFSAAARQHGLAAGGLHPLTEAVGLATAPAVGLKRAFWHCGSALPTEK